MKAGDRLWKLRPWLEAFRQNFLKVAPEEENSIDEMMVPYKGRTSGIKQYMREESPTLWDSKYGPELGCLPFYMTSMYIKAVCQRTGVNLGCRLTLY